ncbi:SLC34A1, partial [Symbiodinium sp. CCMP2456]
CQSRLNAEMAPCLGSSAASLCAVALRQMRSTSRMSVILCASMGHLFFMEHAAERAARRATSPPWIQSARMVFWSHRPLPAGKGRSCSRRLSPFSPTRPLLFGAPHLCLGRRCSAPLQVQEVLQLVLWLRWLQHWLRPS